MKISKVFLSFWIFGLLNNVLYVVILSAAADLVGPLVPKSTVLLADILPALIVKLTAPFFIHLVQHSRRIAALIVLSISGMLLVTFGGLKLRLFGVVLASISSGLGELTFLQLTHYYENISLNGWSSGTGGAGLVGSGLYLLLTTILRASVEITLLIFSLLPLGFLYYFRLPQQSSYIALEPSLNSSPLETFDAMKGHIHTTFKRILKLFLPFMLPLSSVYFSEYLINQAVAPTLLFPLENSYFKHYRDIYVTYGTLYQLGVFISRSSASFIRIRKLYVLSILQMVNLVVLVIQSLFYYIESIYAVMFIIFYEGLLGGASYVNTFMLIIDTVDESEREFVLGATSMADSFGISLAALVGIWLEPVLCGYQVGHGRNWCREK